LAMCALISENWKNPHFACKIITKIFAGGQQCRLFCPAF